VRRFGKKATAIAAVSVGILLASITGCLRRERSTVNASDTHLNLVPARKLLPAYEETEGP
jgi:hypothetical protein